MPSLVRRETNKLDGGAGRDYADAPWLHEQELLELTGDRIHFLKCDIEGANLVYSCPGRLLQVTRKLVCEVHAFAGDVEVFVTGVLHAGFEILFVQRDPDGTATVLGSVRIFV